MASRKNVGAFLPPFVSLNGLDTVDLVTFEGGAVLSDRISDTHIPNIKNIDSYFFVSMDLMYNCMHVYGINVDISITCKRART